jgi:hypothetical protein
MAGHDVVTLRSGYGSSPVTWPRATSAARKGERFSARSVIVLLGACTSVAMFDLSLMLSGLG